MEGLFTFLGWLIIVIILTVIGNHLGAIRSHLTGINRRMKKMMEMQYPELKDDEKISR